ncbi:MAG: 2-succinyl-5-enolpyruvyl-6-hydroxy-3-cyclohexene-1-carboxylate synthase [Ignavibacterium sp.]|uniref:2-succinyl-5-enolpyruvyl-6-hydroxy-3- cyclohexene-1-carboxylic-acid synthase n=1 Tax=Ignavibacterium sp. TaxID=2651167 RepID=UPI0021DEC9A5|nr:2-succinyl-5-enolpyruvyl-6-hydroxy-3-cyclohexene-1-carboxylic-acid synthase [Ignavibacterium sp.]BDQ01637.1 MAG: 2-succinyl-5-enolpyruvyl-6-hydroxy-3-cyclohexene-1-carboxylate synthase [Ignavibacterium sp.]GIV45900.1 MAG: 2-succinyl-5-enolpyruvyl-6-hydroxy-3-cyclohexene-1-carboxylate synthase [Ignavibacterium sp.]
MKIKVNRNILWATLFTDFLVKTGVKHACISPGSRSTPLTFAIASEKKIKSFPVVDERTSGFLALGIAKATNSPVVIVTTSGTATAELYPAIIEAYQSRVPLIICTADRPAYLRNTGSNQTINQNNIYKNHIRLFAELPLPFPDKINLKILLTSAYEAIITSILLNKGPVHLNFQFEKPFEPDSITDTVDESLLEFADSFSESLLSGKTLTIVNRKSEIKVRSIDLITIGAGLFNKRFIQLLSKLSAKLNIPIFADANSGLRFSRKEIPNLISNYEALVRRKDLKKFFLPGTVIHFGRNLTSQNLEDFIVQTKAKRIVVNEHGDRFDSTKKAKIIKSQPESFIEELINKKLEKSSSDILNYLRDFNNKVESVKDKIFENSLNEVNVILQLLELIPEDSNLFIGNSLPVRDLDFYAPIHNKKINVFQNRGTSGIDGIISTAIGVALASGKLTYLVIGDLSFYYDLNALLLAKQFAIPIKIILINNNGGRIFNYLPISKQKEIFQKYFVTPISIDFKKISESFGLSYELIKSLNEYKKLIVNSNKSNSCLILEVRTDSLFTKSLKEKFWNATKKILK